MLEPHNLSSQLGFATKGTSVLGMLAYFSLHRFPKGGTITGPTFIRDSDLLGAFSHVAAN